MFKHDRSYQTNEQRSLAIKSLDSTKQSLTCAQKYSQYASISSSGKTTNCTKMQNVYINGKFIGRNFCIKL